MGAERGQSLRHRFEERFLCYHSGRKGVPIRVAIEQCGMVGVNWTRTEGRLPFRTEICSGETTASCSSVSGCSGSEMERIRSAKEWTGQYHPSAGFTLACPLPPLG